ncbi:hypothetical protein NDU88_004276 [Pleurodeles waltl]|uniref:Uncharacterized protein n=1 Tax=Pleurodeles waltl TaxID=8319 RepID=A0AAV7M6P6_PLEWA|nr:hypothetical protein NDU88_004276 [Pleurodeles waltl]
MGVPIRDQESATPLGGDTTAVILQAIQEFKAALETRIREEGIDVALLHQDLHQTVVRALAAEGKILEQEDMVWNLSSEVSSLPHNSKIQDWAEGVGLELLLLINGTREFFFGSNKLCDE